MTAEVARSTALMRLLLEVDAGKLAAAQVIAHDEAFGGNAALVSWAQRAGIALSPAFDRDLLITVVPGAPVAPGRFELLPPDHWVARPLFVVEMRDEADERCIDMMAADLTCRGRPMTLLGAGELLGLPTALNPATFRGGRPLRLRRDPISWLQDGCRGAVVADASAACSVLPCLPGDVLAEDLPHGRELAAITAGFLNPSRIRVPQEPRRG